MSTGFNDGASTVDSRKLETESTMNYAGFPSFVGWGLEDGHVPTFCPLLDAGQLTKNVKRGSVWTSVLLTWAVLRFHVSFPEGSR